MNEEKILEKVKSFLENKAALDNAACYFITKKLNEEYWDLVQAEESEEEDDELEDTEEETEDETEEETEPFAWMNEEIKLHLEKHLSSEQMDKIEESHNASRRGQKIMVNAMKIIIEKAKKENSND